MTSGGISWAAANWPTVRPRHKQWISFIAPNLLRRHQARQVSRLSIGRRYTARNWGHRHTLAQRAPRLSLAPRSSGAHQLDACPPRRSSRSCAALPAPLRRLARPLRRQRADMPPRVRHHVTEERQRDLGETNEHRRVVPIVLGEEEGTWVQLHEDLALADRRELHNEHRIIVAEAREESAIKKEGRHAVGAALDDIRQAEQQAASGGNRYSPSLGFSFQF